MQDTYSSRPGSRSLRRIVKNHAFAVEVHHHPAVVAKDWAELESEGTVFQSRAWLLPWYRIVAPRYGAAALFVIVRDAVGGHPLMFIPLSIRRRLGLTTIEFPDLGVSDYNAPIVARDLLLSPDQVQWLWGDICRSLPPADIVGFSKIPEDIAGRPNPFIHLRWLERWMKMGSWAIELPRCRMDYDRATLRSKDRKELQRKCRNLIKYSGSIDFFDAKDSEEGRRIFETLMAQHRRRFGERGRREFLDDATYRRFYEAVAFESQEKIAVLSALKASDRLVATLFGLLHGGRYVLIMLSFDQDLNGLSPGIVALNEKISDLIRSGVAAFDLSFGDLPYKRQFGAKRSILYCGVYPLTARGRLFAKVRHWARLPEPIAERSLDVVRGLRCYWRRMKYWFAG